MNILVACEFSQRVTSEFLLKGHNVFSCDLQFLDSMPFPSRHIVSDVLKIINGNCYFYTFDGKKHYIKKWDMIIAFPPCTYFSRVNFLNYYRNGKFNNERFEKAKPYVDLFLKIYNCNCEKICIENPVPMSIFDNILPKYTMFLQPYEFGEPYSKKTCLWLKNLPVLLPTIISYDYQPYVKINGNLINGKFNLRERSNYRSLTFLGVAKAMAEQWG